MNLHETTLPNFVITALYKDSLVLIDEPALANIPIKKTIVPATQPEKEKTNIEAASPVFSTQPKPPTVAPIEVKPVVAAPKEVGTPLSTSITSTTSAPKPEAVKPAILYLGNNNKHITILLYDNEAVHIRDEWLQFLSTVLNACKLSMNDVAIVNLFNVKTTFSEFRGQLQTEFLLMFSVSCADILLPFAIPQYQVQQYDNVRILLSKSLGLMIGATPTVKEEKTKLWHSLQKIFSI